MKGFNKRPMFSRRRFVAIVVPQRLRAVSLHLYASAFIGLLFVALLVFVVACKHSAGSAADQAATDWAAGDYQRAADEYEQFLQQYPTGDRSLPARFKLANIYYLNLHRFEKAREHYTEFLRQDSANVDAPIARERLAEVLSELGRTYESVSEYENLNPSDPGERRRIRLKIADLYFDEKNFSQALTEYQKIIEGTEYDEMSEQAYMREASIYNMRSQYQMALDVYQKLAANSRDDKVQMRAQFGMVDCYAGLGQFDDAIKVLRAIKDEREQAHIAQRMTELEQQKREAAQARTSAPQH